MPGGLPYLNTNLRLNAPKCLQPQFFIIFLPCRRRKSRPSLRRRRPRDMPPRSESLRAPAPPPSAAPHKPAIFPNSSPPGHPAPPLGTAGEGESDARSFSRSTPTFPREMAHTARFPPVGQAHPGPGQHRPAACFVKKIRRIQTEKRRRPEKRTAGGAIPGPLLRVSDFRKPCQPRGNLRHARFGGFLKKQINLIHTGIIALPPGPRANIALSFAAGLREMTNEKN